MTPWTCEEVVKRLKRMGDPTAAEGATRWIAADALRELTSDKVQARFIR